MADAPMEHSGGSGGGFGRHFDDSGDGEFEVSLELEVRLDAQAVDLEAYANQFCEAVRRSLDFWLADQEGVTSSSVATAAFAQHELTVECLEVRAGSIIAKLRVSLRAWGKRAERFIILLAAISTISLAVDARQQHHETDRDKAVVGFEQFVIKTAEEVGEGMTGKKPQVTLSGPSDTKPVMKS